MTANTDSHQEDKSIMTQFAKSYRSAQAVEPSAALDANVLAAARRHIAQKQAIALIQRKPARRRWLWIPGSVLACGVVAMVAFNISRDEAGQAGFVQPASIDDDAGPSKPAYEYPISEPLEAPVLKREGDVCMIRKLDANADVAPELKRLEEAGCAASAARLRQSGRVEQSR